MNIFSHKHFSTILVLSVSVFISCLSTYLSVQYVSRTFIQSLKADSEVFLNKINQAHLEVVRVLNSLNSDEVSDCDENLLRKLRKVMFDLKFVKDIGYFDGDQLVCSTGLGLINPPIVSERPDFIGINKVQIWVNPYTALFQHETPSIVLRLGHYNAMLSRKSLSDLVNIQSSWQLVFLRNDQSMHLAGSPGVYDSYINNKNPENFNVKTCAENHSFCVVVSATKEEFYEKNKVIITLVFFVSLLLFLVVYFYLSSWLGKRHSLNGRILRGLKSNAFFCEYQPIVDLLTGNIVGCEVLARYKDSSGPMYPDVFIPIIESQKATWHFTKQLIEKCVRDLTSMKFSGDVFRVNINFFPQDINSGQILELIQMQLNQQGRLQFVIEITENEQLNSETSHRVMQRLLDAGFEIAVDDFGTGYSNLSQLIDYHCHTLKIDRSFVSEMEDGAIRASLIPHILNIAKQLNVKVVAEGIENEAQHQQLRDLGVQFGQGYFFSRPISAEKLKTLF